MKYRVVFEKSAANWAAYVPDLPGVTTTGKTKKDTQRLIREAIAFHLEGLREDNLLIFCAAPIAKILSHSKAASRLPISIAPLRGSVTMTIAPTAYEAVTKLEFPLLEPQAVVLCLAANHNI